MYFDIPSVDDMEVLIAKSAPKPKAPKAPCKYGPRDVNGFCPSKPPSEPRASSGGAGAGGRACKYGPRDADGNCPKKPAAQKAPCKYGPRSATTGLCPKKSNLEKLLTKSVNVVSRNVTNAAVDVAFDPAARAAVKAGIAKMTESAKAKAAAIGAGITGLGAAGAAGVAAAGVTAFLATSYLKGKIEQIIMDKRLTAVEADRKKLALLNQAFFEFEQIMGRDGTPAELKAIQMKVFPDYDPKRVF